MKKLSFLFSFIFLSIFTLTGCVKFSYNFEVNDDKLKMEEIRAFDISLVSDKRPFIDKIFDAQVEKAKKFSDKYTVVKYDEPPYLGVKKIKEGNTNSIDIKELPVGFSTPQAKIIDVENSAFKHVYRVHLYFNPEEIIEKARGITDKLTPSVDNSSDFNSEQISTVPGNPDKSYKIPEGSENFEASSVSSTPSYGALPGGFQMNDLQKASQIEPKFEVKIKIPKKASKHNAKQESSDNEYVWDLSPQSESEIFIEYTKYDFSSLGVMLIIIFILGIAIHYFKKFTKENDI